MPDVVGCHGAIAFKNGFSVKGDGDAVGGEERSTAGVTEESN